MKRSFAMLLTLALTLGLMTPVWAQEVVAGPLTTTTMETTFVTIPASPVPDPYMETKDSPIRDESDPAFRAKFDEGYKAGYAVGYAAFEAERNASEPVFHEMPTIETDADIAYAKGYENGYWDGYFEASNLYWEAQMQAEREARIVAQGGAPGQINVRLNESMVPFADNFPEFQNGYTMVPVRSLMNAVNAVVTWEEATGTVTVETADILLSIPLGSGTATLTVNGETEEIPLDAPAYEKNGSAYVPLRFITETLGYTVYWDNAHQTVVLLDLAAIAAEIDESYTVYNRFIQAHKISLDTRKQMSERLDLKLELIDTIGGNRSFSFPVSVDVKLGDGGLTAEGSIDLSKIKDIIALYVPEAEEIEDGDLPMMISLLSQEHSFSLKLTPEGMLYLKSPLADTVMGMNLSEGTAPSGAWYALDLETLYPGWRDLLEIESLGEIIVLSASLNAYGNPIDYYDQIQTAAAMYKIISDSAFTKSGSEYRLLLDVEDVVEMTRESLGDYAEYAEETAQSVRDTFTAFSIDLRLRENGSYSMSAKIKAEVDYLGNAFSLDQKASGTVNGGEQTITVQLRNLFNFTLKETLRIQTRDLAPDFSLPRDAAVIDLLEATMSAGSSAEPVPAPMDLAACAARALDAFRADSN